MYVSTCTYFDFHFLLATQMWCLARYLPVMVGDLVSNGDQQWNHYLKLLEIIDLYICPSHYCRQECLHWHAHRGFPGGVLSAVSRQTANAKHALYGAYPIMDFEVCSSNGEERGINGPKILPNIFLCVASAWFFP